MYIHLIPKNETFGQSTPQKKMKSDDLIIDNVNCLMLKEIITLIDKKTIPDTFWRTPAKML